MDYTYEQAQEMYSKYDQMLHEYNLTGNYDRRRIHSRDEWIDLEDLCMCGDLSYLDKGDTMESLYTDVNGFIKICDIKIDQGE